MIYAPPDLAHLSRFLSTRLDADAATVTEVKRSWPGMSRETWFVTAEVTRGHDTMAEKFVFRMDPPGGGFGLTSLPQEVAVYQHLAPTPVPVPEVLFYETGDSEWLIDGREFFVRAWVDGVMEPEHLHDPDPQYDAFRVEVCQAHLDNLAVLHTLDWHALGFDAFMYTPSSEAECIPDYVRYHVEHFERNQLEPFPAFTEAVHFFLDNPAPPAPRISLTKGNNFIGEELFDGTRVVAMCDWEGSWLNDPALDFAACQQLDQLWSVDDALAYYEERSGIHIAPENLHYARLLRAMRGVVGLHGGLRGIAEGTDQRLQLATLGLSAYRTEQVLAQIAGF
jgi:aminoglycoside phosphotransferase (APT) family kinase protein